MQVLSSDRRRDGERGAARGGSALLLLGPPFVAFLLARVIVLLAAHAASGRATDVAMWTQGDAWLYLSIAEAGYLLHPCDATYPAGSWCGNAGWLPGFPLLIRMAGPVLGSPRLAALLVAGLFQFAGLAVLWRWFLGARLRVQTALALLLAALFPGAVYYQAAFPISQFLFFAMLALVLFAGDRLALGAASGALAAFSYATGFVLTPVLGLWAVVTRAGKRLFNVLAASLAVALGFAAVLVVLQVTVGAWDAFFRVQAKYGHGLSNPVTTLGGRLEALVRPALWASTGLDTIALMADSGRYLCAEDGGGRAVVANRTEVGPWETFAIVPQREGLIALRTDNGHYVSVGSDERRTVTASASSVGVSETFRLADLGGGRIALETSEGRFVAAAGGGGGELVANRTRVGAWAALARVKVKSTAPALIVGAVQSLFVTALLLCTAIAVLWRKRARPGAPEPDASTATCGSRLDLLVLIYSGAFFLFPLVMGGAVTARRAEALLLPLAALTRRLPLALQVAAVGIAAWLAFAVAKVYFVLGD